MCLCRSLRTGSCHTCQRSVASTPLRIFPLLSSSLRSSSLTGLIDSLLQRSQSLALFASTYRPTRTTGQILDNVGPGQQRAEPRRGHSNAIHAAAFDLYELYISLSPFRRLSTGELRALFIFPHLYNLLPPGLLHPTAKLHSIILARRNRHFPFSLDFPFRTNASPRSSLLSSVVL